MRFGVLGSLAVWTSAGEPVAIPGLKVRALLADLLTHEGRPVPVDRLVDDVWGRRPPRDPLGALHNKVWHLRRSLETAEPGGRELVVFLQDAYQLRVATGDLDSLRFTELLAKAGKATDPATKVALFSDALALWRGRPFADFADEEFTHAAAARFEEQRMVALEDQAQARLELGEHGVVAGELAALVAEYPLRERLRALQLRALYRAGRTSEALAGYRELRGRLARELGVDPGPELTALHQAILRRDPGLGAVPGPAPHTNLPAPLTSLVGREEAVEEVAALLGATRMVTLTGPGGVGKTRLAVETARRLVSRFPDGVWLVELGALGRTGPASAAGGPAEAVMAALGIREDAGGGRTPARPAASPVDRLVRAVRGKRMLVVLDNCEHVVDAVAALATSVLHAAPDARLVVTSREPLNVSGETVLVVPPLEVPVPASPPEPGAAHPSAVRLFVSRAASAAPGFTLRPDNAEAVAEICRRLDGIPLALELAATRVRGLGVHQVAARLNDRFRLLATGYRGAPPRQRTLRAVFDWSWDLLTERERVVLRRLAVHSGGCTLEAAEAVCAGGPVRPEDIPDLLARLVDRSLVLAVDHGGTVRYRLLESVADYGLDRLREAGEYEAVRLRHVRHYVGVAEAAEPHLRGGAQRHWLELLTAEAANLRRALDGAVHQGAAGLALRLVDAMAWYWYLSGRLRQAQRALDTALAVPGPPAGADPHDPVHRARVRARAWRAGFGVLIGERADHVARCRAAVEEFTGVVDRVGRARAQWFAGFALFGTGDQSVSEELVDQALTGFRSLEDRWGEAAVLCVRANLAELRGDLLSVRRDGERSAELFDRLRDCWGRLQAVEPLASLAEITGDYDRAATLHGEGLRMAEELGLWPEACDRLSGLGRIALLRGDHARARALHQRAVRLAEEQSFKPGEIHARLGLGLGARREGRLDEAEEHMRGVLAWHRQVDFEPGNALILTELGFIAEQRGDAETAQHLHTESFTAARRTGDLRALALALEGLAGALAAGGRPGRAALLLGTASAAREAAGAPLPAAERGDVERIEAAVRPVLGEEGYAAEFRRGRLLQPDEAVGCLPDGTADAPSCAPVGPASRRATPHPAGVPGPDRHRPPGPRPRPTGPRPVHRGRGRYRPGPTADRDRSCGGITVRDERRGGVAVSTRRTSPSARLAAVVDQVSRLMVFRIHSA